MEYSEDHINRILWRDSAWQSALMASIFKSSADSLYRRTVYSCNMCLRDRIGDSCAGCAIYSGRKSDSAYSDPDRRTWNIACTTAFLILVGKRINMKERVVIQEAYGLSTLQGMIRFIERVLWGTFLVEGIGCNRIFISVYSGVWCCEGNLLFRVHSISAFCNAGVDILGDSSFTRYVNTPVITITTTMLVILSGLGYPVWIDLAKNIKMTIQSKGKRPVGRTITRLSLQSKIVLTMTLFLLTLGTLGFYLLEHHNPATMGTLNAAGKFQAAFFQSVTTRTAGFASISQSGLTNGSKLLAAC